MLIAIRLNRVSGYPNPAWDEDGDPINEDDWELETSDEDMIYVNTEDVMDIENALLDVRDSLYVWKHQEEGSEASQTATEAEGVHRAGSHQGGSTSSD